MPGNISVKENFLAGFLKYFSTVSSETSVYTLLKRPSFSS